MTPLKRFLDLLIIALITPLVLPIAIIVALAILIFDGRPIFFVQERMKSRDTAFNFWKFRTMTVDAQDTGASGGHKAHRITRLGRILRRTHFDEIPQAWNVVRGDVTLVGPRAPLRKYVEQFPDLYARVLRSRPGLTGLASYVFSKHEGYLLRDCKTPEETEEIYSRRCVPRKARLDLIYQKNQSVCLDFWVFWITTARILKLPGGRKSKITYR